MAKKRSTTRRAGAEAERVAAGYSRLLTDAVKGAGLDRRDLVADDGLSQQVIWRVLDHRQDPSLAAAARVRQRLLELRPKLEVPPPAVAVESAAHYAWIKLGTDMLAEDPDGFTRALDRVRIFYDARRRRRGALSALAAIAGDDDSSDP